MDMQALIKFVAESQVLEATWKLHLEHLVKFLSKCQALQGAGESDHLKILATQIAKGSKNQTLQTNWESHLLQPLVAKAVWSAQGQASKARKCQSIRVLIEIVTQNEPP